MELLSAIKNRRSVRKYTDYYVTDQEIKEMLDAARWAPSWANTQVWEFIVVRETELIKEVTETYSDTNPARKGSLSSSALIVCCAKKNVSGCKEGKQRTKFSEWFLFDLGLAVQNLCLRAFELGIGTVIVGSMDHDRCAKLLSLPAAFEVVAVIPLGRPLDPGKEAPARKEIKDFVHLNIYGKRYGQIY